MKTLAALSFLISFALADKVTCPKLTCHQSLFKKRCYETNYSLGKQQQIRTWPCEQGKLCRYEHSDFVPFWPLDKAQLTSNKLNLKNNDLWGYCTDVYSWEKGDLLPGRSCGHNFECQSNRCIDRKCKGLEEGYICRDHQDCNVGLVCKEDNEYRTNFVDRKLCRQPLDETEPCNSDNDCEVKSMCMKIGNRQRCRRAFILKDGEEADDGRQCISGSVNNKGRCATTTLVRYNGNILQSPYECQPNSDVVCKYFDSDDNQVTFNAYLSIAEYSSENSCQCTNSTENGESWGYCNPLGNDQWKTFFTYYFEEILPFISGCHIMDRWNPIAWMDCGASVTNDEATQFLTLYKEVSYYQWMQDDDSKQCVKNLLAHYGDNWNAILDSITDAGIIVAVGVSAAVLSIL